MIVKTRSRQSAIPGSAVATGMRRARKYVVSSGFATTPAPPRRHQRVHDRGYGERKPPAARDLVEARAEEREVDAQQGSALHPAGDSPNLPGRGRSDWLVTPILRQQVRTETRECGSAAYEEPSSGP